MNCLKIQLSEKATKAIDYLNSLKLKFDNVNTSLTGTTIVIGIRSLGVVNIVSDDVIVYSATSGTDISTSGKTALTQLPASTTTKYYLFVCPSNKISYLSFVPAVSDGVYYLDISSSTKNIAFRVEDIALAPANSYNHLQVQSNTSKIGLYTLSFNELINSELIVNFSNMLGHTAVTGTYTAAHTSVLDAAANLVNFFMQFGLSGATLDLALVSSKLLYLSLGIASGGTSSTVSCSSINVPWLKSTKNSIQINLSLSMDSTSIDNLLIAAAAKPSLSSASFLGAIVLKGTRTSASDSAVATLNAAGITVTITA